MKRVLVLLSLALFAAGCGSGVDNEALRSKVLDAHDEVMPKMGIVMNLKKRVETKANELAAQDSTDTQIAELRDLAQDLDNAYKGMMDWMHGWGAGEEPHKKGTTTKEETTAFYQAEQKKVDKVKEDINSAIAAAQAALK